MGILARAFEELRFDPGRWLNDDDGESPRVSAGVPVNRGTTLGLATVWRCVDLLSSAISQAPKDIILKVNGRSFPQYQLPGWMTEPEAGNPALTINDHFSQVALSLLLDGNFFVLVLPDVMEPRGLVVLDPRRVRVRSSGMGQPPVYELLSESGAVQSEVGPMQMLHGTWLRPPASLRGLSPLENLRQSFGGAIATQEFSNRFFGQGATLSFGVEVPGPMTLEQRNALTDSLKQRHAGLRNSHAIGILTGGAKFINNLAPTPEQAQMLATREFQREELAAIYGVPPHYVNAQANGASSFASAKVYGEDLKSMAILPLAERIEPHYNRLLSVPSGVAAPNASVQFKFNLDHFARADLKTRAETMEVYVRSGQKTPNEARALEDLGPLPGGDLLYMQQQMVPLGTTPAAPAARSDEVAA